MALSAPTGSRSGLEVLVADDDDDLREAYAERLAAAGFDVLCARDGKEAVGVALARRPVAIVMDLQMPEMDGYAAIGEIRSHLAGRPYVVAVSAFVGEGSRRAAYEAGADDVLAKPISADVLVAVVSAALRAHAT